MLMLLLLVGVLLQVAVVQVVEGGVVVAVAECWPCIQVLLGVLGIKVDLVGVLGGLGVDGELQ